MLDKITKSTVDSTKSAKDFTIKKWKKFIRKRALILLILVFYIHGEYLNYIEFKSENEANYIGISFVIKNTLILSIVLGYIYYYRKITQTQDSIKETKETIVKENKIDDKEKVSSLDQFLEDDEIDR